MKSAYFIAIFSFFLTANAYAPVEGVKSRGKSSLDVRARMPDSPGSYVVGEQMTEPLTA